MLYSRRWLRAIGHRSECMMNCGISIVLILEDNPTQTDESTLIATPSTTRRLSTCPPLAEPSSQQGNLTMAPTSYTSEGLILADSKPEHGESDISGGVVATDGQRTPSPTGSIGSLDTPSTHTRLVHGEVLSTAWCAPTELQSRAQSLLHGFSAQQGRVPAMRDVDSGLRVYNEPALPPPYTLD
ncbi:hypothetical protein C8Q74DRAFT_293901 [Fomes fomentarius]|nr:hypothetical protein C8Q74DRAFT_293901 [Fomes fomentarius]